MEGWLDLGLFDSRNAAANIAKSGFCFSMKCIKVEFVTWRPKRSLQKPLLLLFSFSTIVGSEIEKSKITIGIFHYGITSKSHAEKQLLRNNSELEYFFGVCQSFLYSFVDEMCQKFDLVSSVFSGFV